MLVFDEHLVRVSAGLQAHRWEVTDIMDVI